MNIRSIEENKFLSDLCKEYNIKLPNNLQNRIIYKEIENFKDTEYIYCIAYEMLIRTDEYNTILKEYKPLKNKSKINMTNDEFLKLRKLINRMNDLGLKKTSFLGFDCDDDNEHIFKRIEYYNQIINSPWNVRMIYKFQIDPSLGYKSIFHMLIDYYINKKLLYKLENNEFIPIESNQSNIINNIHITDIEKVIDVLFVSYTLNGNKKYKALKDFIYLNELDNDFLSQLKEKKSNDLLIQIKSDFSHHNTEFWNKYYVNDIKDGFKRLIKFHLDNNSIYNQNIQLINASLDEILENPSDFYIPCVNRLMRDEKFKWDRKSDLILNNEFIRNLEFDGVKSIVADRGYIKISKEENIYLMQISEYISLNLLNDSFLETLTYEDLKNTYINTEPIYSRPRLMFDEARLTNIPINLNLSKEDLLLYINQIKNDYDRNKNIVKTDIEYFFDLILENDLVKMPSNIKDAHEKRNSKDKKLFPKKREDFKKSIASAFYIYDLYKFFIRIFEIKKKCIRRRRKFEIKKRKEYYKNKGVIINKLVIDEIKEIAEKEIKNYENNNLITCI